MDSEGIVGEAGRFWVLAEEQTPTPTTPSNCRLHMAHEMMRGMGWSIEPVRCIDVGQVPFFLFLFFLEETPKGMFILRVLDTRKEPSYVFLI